MRTVGNRLQDSRRAVAASLRNRRGASTVDYVLLLGLLLPIAAFALPVGKRILQLVFRMTCTLIGWPFP